MNTTKITLIIVTLLFCSSTNVFNISTLHAQLFKKIVHNNNPDYVPPKYQSKFLDKNGLVNVSKKYRSKRLDPAKERIVAPEIKERIRIEDGDFAAPLGSHFYQKNGLVNVSKKTVEKRLTQEDQLPFLYGRSLYQERRVYKVHKPFFSNIFKISLDKINIFKSREKVRHRQEVVSPR
jgi:hypothetical protein